MISKIRLSEEVIDILNKGGGNFVKKPLVPGRIVNNAFPTGLSNEVGLD
jgi:hypothetical protein